MVSITGGMAAGFTWQDFFGKQKALDASSRAKGFPNVGLNASAGQEDFGKSPPNVKRRTDDGGVASAFLEAGSKL